MKIIKIGLKPVSFLLLIVALCSCNYADLQKEKPNIVVIYADDFGYGDVQCCNPEHGKIPTLHIK